MYADKVTPSMERAIDETNRRRDKQIALAGQDQRWRVNAAKPACHIEALDQAEAMGHDALVSLPTLPRDELDQRPRTLLAAEK